MNKDRLNKIYAEHCALQGSDILEYMPLLGEFSQQCYSIVEMGVREVNTTWAFLWGLAQGDGKWKRLVSYDLYYHKNIALAKEVAQEVDVEFQFIEGNSAEVDIEPTNALFIDTEHTYQHLMKELRRHESKVNGWILVHDTSGVYGTWEDWPYNHERRGELANSPEKYGMHAGVMDFLKEFEGWKLIADYKEGNGLCILERQ